MFHAGCDDVIACFESAEQGDIQCLGAIFGEDHTVVAVPVEKGVECVTAIFHERGARQGELMSASTGISADFDGGAHGGEDGVGFSAARGGVVEINHRRTSFSLIFIKYSILKRSYL